MVDFNNEATIGTPSTEVVKILILQRRYDVFEALEQYNTKEKQEQQADPSSLRARLFTLFMEIQAGLKRKLKGNEYEDLLAQMTHDKDEEVMKAIYTLNEYLDSIHLTKIDTKRQYDTTRVEKENREKQL